MLSSGSLKLEPSGCKAASTQHTCGVTTVPDASSQSKIAKLKHSSLLKIVLFDQCWFFKIKPVTKSCRVKREFVKFMNIFNFFSVMKCMMADTAGKI